MATSDVTIRPNQPEQHESTAPAASHGAQGTPLLRDPWTTRWITRSWFTPSGGLVAEAAAGVLPITVFERLARRRHVLFLDSAAPDTVPDDPGSAATAGPPLGRYSFVAADPIHSIEVESPPADAAEPMARQLAEACGQLRGPLTDLACPTIPGLPPFQGGIAGLISYEAGLARLGLPAPHPSGPPVPLLSLHVYDVVFAYDHELNRGWFISQGLPARGPTARRQRATERLAAVLDPTAPPAPPAATASSSAAPSPGGHPLPLRPRVRSTHTRESYLDMVRAGIEFVRAGDIFQVNLAQQFAVAAEVDPVAVYAAARRINPAPCAGYFATGTTAIASMSPERFLQASRGIVRMHPIKGTRRVLASPEADLYAADDLGDSAKDRAENVMIVDLVRNDLARVCRPESVRVESLCRLERYRYVQHLVSIVAGRLRPGLGPLDAFEAAIPGGSVTGAPKHRACEIISQLEGFRRGGYCGSLGYFGFDGAADFNLLIRTFVIAPGEIRFAAGGGITAASIPDAEHAESLHKAEGMLRVLDALGIAGDSAS